MNSLQCKTFICSFSLKLVMMRSITFCWLFVLHPNDCKPECGSYVMYSGNMNVVKVSTTQKFPCCIMVFPLNQS